MLRKIGSLLRFLNTVLKVLWLKGKRMMGEYVNMKYIADSALVKSPTKRDESGLNLVKSPVKRDEEGLNLAKSDADCDESSLN